MNKRKAYQLTLPKKRMSAGCLFFDDNGRFLIVNPTYKEPWEIPGGTVEANESPRQAAIREVAEEIGLNCEPRRLLCIDYSKENDRRTESVQLIFDGGVLSKKQIKRITLPADELSEYRFVAPKKGLNKLNPKLRRRIHHCLRVLAGKTTVLYLEEQIPMGD